MIWIEGQHIKDNDLMTESMYILTRLREIISKSEQGSGCPLTINLRLLYVLY